MAQKTVSESHFELAEIVEPNDANFLGKAFGGAILAKIDLCAYATASRYAGAICVTASFDRVDFHSPIEVGEVVSMIGKVTYVGRTSVEVTIELYATNVLSGERRHTNTARVTMVALGPDQRPTEVPRLVCESREEKIGFLEGKLRRELRGNSKEVLESWIERFRDFDEPELDRLIEAKSLTK